MPLTVIRDPPQEASYTPLHIFQSETPTSFDTPVLHFRHNQCIAQVSKDHARRIPIFDNAGNEVEQDQLSINGMDMWITSENLILFNTTLSVGATIPYTSLSLHAIQRSAGKSGVYMQITLTPDIANVSNSDNYDEDDLLEITILPVATGEKSQDELADALFKAMSDCASLHPDPSNSDDDNDDGDRIVFESNGDEPRLEGFPGEGGWITAENVHQFQFEDAEDGTGALGPGAGTIRLREDSDEQAMVADQDGVDSDETKWRRTG